MPQISEHQFVHLYLKYQCLRFPKPVAVLPIAIFHDVIVGLLLSCENMNIFC